MRQTKKKQLSRALFLNRDSIIGKSTLYDINLMLATNLREASIGPSRKSSRRFIFLVEKHAVISKMEILDLKQLDNKTPNLNSQLKR